MRTIKFRGIDTMSGEMVYGDLAQQKLTDGSVTTAIVQTYATYDVNSKTIGQFTGLFDKNGKEIYEGDILEVEGMYAKVVWNKEKASFEYEYLHPTQIANTFYEFNMPYLSVVGNIHDNKDLIKGV